MSSNQFFTDAASRHAVFLQMYSAGVERFAANALRDALVGVSSYLEDAENEVPNIIRYRAYTDYSARIDELERALLAELNDLVIEEAEFTKEMVEAGSKAAIALPPPEQLSLALTNTQLVINQNRVSITQELSKFGEGRVAQINQVINDGYTEGLTSQQMASKVRDLIPLQSNQAASLVRTASNAASSLARSETLFNNLDVLDGFRILATLDSNTTKLCAGMDGKKILIDPEFTQNYQFIGSYDGKSLYFTGTYHQAVFLRGGLFSPYHWGCRTTPIPIVKRQYDLLADVEGDRPSVGPEGAEQQGANTTYGGWLRKQPASFQEEVLGVTGAKLFRSGELKIENFVDNSGKTYTIDQLRSLYPLAFERANL